MQESPVVSYDVVSFHGANGAVWRHQIVLVATFSDEDVVLGRTWKVFFFVCVSTYCFNGIGSCLITDLYPLDRGHSASYH